MLRMTRLWYLIWVLPAVAQDGVLFKSDVRLVEVYASIFDQKGRYLDGLTRDRFALIDNGTAQPIVAFEGETQEVSCAILLDTTGSMARSLPTVKNAVLHLIDEMRPYDWVATY